MPAEYSTTTACFSVYAPAGPFILPRVLNMFARLDVVPARLTSTVGASRRDELCIDIQVGGMDAAAREQIAARLRNLVDVSLVLTSEKGYVSPEAALG